MGSSSRRWLNQSTHSSVASSTASRLCHDCRWVTSVLYRSLMVSARAWLVHCHRSPPRCPSRARPRLRPGAWYSGSGRTAHHGRCGGSGCPGRPAGGHTTPAPVPRARCRYGLSWTRASQRTPGEYVDDEGHVDEALPGADVDEVAHQHLAPGKVHILDPQAQRLQQAQARAIQQAGDYPAHPILLREHGTDLIARQHNRQMPGLLGPHNTLQLGQPQPEYLLVEKQQRRQGLILGRVHIRLVRPNQNTCKCKALPKWTVLKELQQCRRYDQMDYCL